MFWREEEERIQRFGVRRGAGLSRMPETRHECRDGPKIPEHQC
jgi:hypothetical protein